MRQDMLENDSKKVQEAVLKNNCGSPSMKELRLNTKIFLSTQIEYVLISNNNNNSKFHKLA